MTLTAPLRFGQLRLRPVLDAFLDAHPAVQARLMLLDRMVNLVEEGVEAAVRIATLPDSNLVATRLGQARRVLCAAPAYLDRHGTPQSPSALRDHACIVGPAGAEAEIWRVPPAPGKPPAALDIRPRLIVNSAAAALDSAVAGHGVIRVMSYQAAEAVRAGNLVVLLAQHEPSPIPAHLVTPPNRAANAKQRAFFAFAVPQLRERLTRAEADMRGVDAA